jgi:hypothetical protein
MAVSVSVAVPSRRAEVDVLDDDMLTVETSASASWIPE